MRDADGGAGAMGPPRRGGGGGRKGAAESHHLNTERPETTIVKGIIEVYWRGGRFLFVCKYLTVSVIAPDSGLKGSEYFLHASLSLDTLSPCPSEEGCRRRRREKSEEEEEEDLSSADGTLQRKRGTVVLRRRSTASADAKIITAFLGLVAGRSSTSSLEFLLDILFLPVVADDDDDGHGAVIFSRTEDVFLVTLESLSPVLISCHHLTRHCRQYAKRGSGFTERSFSSAHSIQV